MKWFQRILGGLTILGAKIGGWSAGALLVLATLAWKHLKLTILLAFGFAIIGTSAGLAMGGTAINAWAPFMAFGALLGISIQLILARSPGLQKKSEN